MKSAHFIETYERLLLAAECKTQAELAHFLQLRQALIANAYRRGDIPAEWITHIAQTKNIEKHWILTGEEPRLSK